MSVRFEVFVLVSVCAYAATAGAQAPDAAALQRMMEQAQGQSTPDAAQMELLMQHGQAMQKCIADIDPATIEAMRRDGEAAMHEVKKLCAEGRRDAAQARAIDFAQHIEASPELRKMTQCGAQMAGLLPSMVPQHQFKIDKESHVCDAQ